MENKKLAKDFRKYLFGGIVWTALSIPLSWLFIDYVGMYASIASIIIVILGIITRFYLYSSMKLINTGFLKFASADVVFSLLTVALMTITIDFMKIQTLIATPVIVIGLFVLKFIMYNQIKMIASVI